MASAILASSKSVGGEAILELLKNYCRGDDEVKSDIKKGITVGVIGYPNVGKSSLINSLKKNKVVGVASLPGYTTSVQQVLIINSFFFIFNLDPS